jgi:hypothetical protein
VTSDTYIVTFCEQVPAGALRVDQLRGIALGHALACLLEATGANVARQRPIPDIDGSFGKASAAYLAQPDGLDPAATGEKSDHFVGRLSTLYDKEARGDVAELLLVRLGRGEQEARTVWRLIRGWTLSGQNETLGRLGVCFQRALFYSELAQQAEPLLRLGRAHGLFDGAECAVSPDGATPRPGIASYPSATAQLYEVTAWRSIMIEFPGALHIRVTDDEQHDHLEQHLRALVPGARAYPSAIVYKRSSATSHEATGRSEPSIDDLLDALATRKPVRELANDERPSCSIHDLSTTVLLGAALGEALNAPFAVSEPQLCTDANPGWILAQAWAKVCAAGEDGAAATVAPEDRRSRPLASSELRPLIDRAAETLNVAGPLQFLVRLSASYLNGATNQAASNDLRALLGTGLAALGLVRPAVGLEGVR